jgi:dCTP deaminase
LVAAVNLTLDPVIRVFRTNAPGLIIDPGAPGYKATDLIRSATDPLTITDQGWELPRGKLVLAWTRERVDLDFKGKVAARVEGKSGLARIGLGVHVTAPAIHAGFPGTIQLELVNHGPLEIKLRPGMAICQPEPGAAAVTLLPKMTAHGEPGGVNWITRQSPAAKSASSLQPRPP